QDKWRVLAPSTETGGDGVEQPVAVRVLVAAQRLGEAGNLGRQVRAEPAQLPAQRAEDSSERLGLQMDGAVRQRAQEGLVREADLFIASPRQHDRAVGVDAPGEL